MKRSSVYKKIENNQRVDALTGKSAWRSKVSDLSDIWAEREGDRKLLNSLQKESRSIRTLSFNVRGLIFDMA